MVCKKNTSHWYYSPTECDILFSRVSFSENVVSEKETWFQFRKNLLSAKKSFQSFVVQVHSYICDILESRDINWITLKCLPKMSNTRCTTYRTSIAE